jgi:hypothetical protein
VPLCPLQVFILDPTTELGEALLNYMLGGA